MFRLYSKSLVLALLLIAVLFSGCSRHVKISTGFENGLYYPTGKELAKLLKKEGFYFVSVSTSSGSVQNIEDVANEKATFALVQSDMQYQKYKGLIPRVSKGNPSLRIAFDPSKNAEGKHIRSLFSLYPESITLVARKKSKISHIRHLTGRRVNIGQALAGYHYNARDVLNAYAYTKHDLTLTEEHLDASIEAFKEERMDAFFYTVGHPNEAFRASLGNENPYTIIPIKGRDIDALLKQHHFYTKSLIPGQYYPNNPAPIETISVLTTVITSKLVDESLAYAMTKAMVEQLEDFKKTNPVYANITRESLLKGLTAPLHPGAYKYYVEAGMKELIPARLLPNND
mgnify:CR=1 FL=1